MDPFKEEFKRYRFMNCSEIGQYGIVDVRHPHSLKVLLNRPVDVERNLGSRASALGLRPPEEWQLYGIKSVPGLIVVPDPFRRGCQHRWVWRCLVDYPCKPNVCNLDAHLSRPGGGALWPATPPSSTAVVLR